MKPTQSTYNMENLTIPSSELWTTAAYTGNLNTTDGSMAGKNEDFTEEYIFPAIKLSAYMVPVFFSIIFLVGVTGNVVVITVMLKIDRHQAQGINPTNRFIFNLAVADLLFLFFCVPFQGVIYSTEYWPFGGFMCVFCEFFQKVAMLASVYTLVALSLDRYFAVAFATSAMQFRTRKNSVYCLVAIWVIAVGFGIPATLTRQQFYYEGQPLCIPNLNMPTLYKVYVTFIFVMGYAIPLLFIFLCYVGVVRAMTRSAKNSAVTGSKLAQNSKKRVTKIVIVVVILFAIDWFPYHLNAMWIQFGTFPFNEATYVLQVLSHCLSYANSCGNPVIYAFVSQRFRNDFKRVFSCQYVGDAVGNVKLYSRRMADSFRSPAQGSRMKMRRSTGGNDSVSELKLQPRTPIIRKMKFERSDSGCCTCSTYAVDTVKPDTEENAEDVLLD